MMAEPLRPNAGASLLWWVTVILAVPAALVAFSQLISSPFEGLLVQGPLVVDPTLGDRLGTVLSPLFLHWTQLAIHILGFLLFAGLGALIAVRSREPLSLISAAMLVAVGTSLFAPLDRLGAGWSRLAHVVGAMAPDGVDGYWVSLAGLLLLAFLRLFLSQRPRPWEQALLLTLALIGVAALIWPAFPFHPRSLHSPWKQLVTVGIPTVALARAWASPEGRHRRAVRPVLVTLTLIAVASGILVLLRPSLRPDAFGLVLATPRLQALYGINTLFIATVAVFALPFSIVFAVVRYRLFEIDVLINRALVYGSLTVIATLLFGAVTLAMSAAAGGLIGSGVTGVATGQIAAVAGVLTGTALAIGLQPLRRRLQRFIDHRFYREKFDAELALERFTDRLTTVVDRQVLEEELAKLLASTLQPVNVRLVGLEGLPELPAQVAVFHGSGSPVPFPEASDGVAVPLAGTEGLAGAIVIGPRRAGIPYRGLELEFLQRTAERVGPALRIVDLFEAQERARSQRERVEQELGLAQRIQRELLPRSVPQIEGWQLEVFYQPAREVGGDFYDFYLLADGRLGVVVGDVTDKGMPAALVMASCRTVLRGVALGTQDLSPGEVLARANDLLVGDIPNGMFITCLYGVLNPVTGHFLFANAGHNPPLRASPAAVDLVMARGMPLGLMSEMVYDEAETSVRDGELILLSSDGITEAHNPDKEMFGFGRMKASALSLDSLLAQHASFVAGREQEDDITLISLKRSG